MPGILRNGQRAGGLAHNGKVSFQTREPILLGVLTATTKRQGQTEQTRSQSVVPSIGMSLSVAEQPPLLPTWRGGSGVFVGSGELGGIFAWGAAGTSGASLTWPSGPWTKW